MMGDRLVAQKPLFTSSASIGMSPRTILLYGYKNSAI